MAGLRSSRPRHGFRGTKPEPDSSRRNAGTQRAILAAAARLVRRHGYNRVTIEAVAAEAGAGKQTIYRWWRTKPALFAELLGRSATLPTRRETLAAGLSRRLTAVAREVASPLAARIHGGLLAEAAADPTLAAELRARLFGNHARELAGLLSKGRGRGEIRRNADIRTAAEQLLAAVWFRRLIEGRPVTGRFIARLVAQTVRGIGV